MTPKLLAAIFVALAFVVYFAAVALSNRRANRLCVSEMKYWAEREEERRVKLAAERAEKMPLNRRD